MDSSYTMWQERVIKEKAALSEKIEKLRAFLESPAVEQISIAENNRLQLQCGAMELYAHMLSERIDNFH